MKNIFCLICLIFAHFTYASDTCSPKAQKLVEASLLTIKQHKNDLDILKLTVEKATAALPHHRETLESFYNHEYESLSIQLVDSEFELRKLTYQYPNCSKQLRSLASTDTQMTNALNKLIETLPEEKDILISLNN